MSEILKPARPTDIDILLPLMEEYSRFDQIDHDSRRARRDNNHAQRYYERLGFGRRDRYFLLTRRL